MSNLISRWTLAVAVLLATVIWSLSIPIYNIYFHPLSKYPGPKLWAAYQFTSLWSLLRGKSVHDVEKIHAYYGPIVRIAPNEISVAGPDGWKDIYATRPGHKIFPKNGIWYGGKTIGQPESLINVENPADHERMRRLLNPAFTPKAVDSQECTVQFYVDLLISKLRDRAAAKESVDIVSWYNFVTFDIVGDLGFGEPFNCLQDSQYHIWVSTIFTTFKNTFMLGALGCYPLLSKVLGAMIPSSIREPALRNRAMGKEKVHRRLNLEKERNDFMTPVIRGEDSKSMSLSEIEGTFHTIIVAGSETTATVLSGITNYLTRDAAVMNRLCVEIRSAFQNEKDIDFSATRNLPYLNAVIQEGMRMCPPTPAGIPRIVPEGGDTVCGHWFPGGTNISLHSWSTYRSSANFHNPLQFIPERWLQSITADETSPYYHDKRYAVQVFSLGPRACLGKNLAWAELRLILARMIWNFDIEIACDADGNAKLLDWTKQKTWVLVEKEPLEVKLTSVQV
ncbi:hypothetical protein HYFRA_00001626 [Hymenoscyphus fraxineus]|uniref:Uncharacterized protein n=1 Tax=Hymenoscyphus fraxineus TaxID=746836 RepID=A0A9N9PXU8_9HELO|nr:hypothetical protein HYFRA_00001626 [Hymenoscyphus fraxineus]